MKVTASKDLSREDIQRDVKEALKAVVEKHREAGVDVTSAEYIRRLPRACIHEGAKIVLDNGGGPSDFAYMIQAAWAKEQSSESLGEAVIVAPTPASEGSN